MSLEKTVKREHPEIEGFRYVRTLGEGGFARTYVYEDLERHFGHKFVVVKVPKDKEREESLVKGDIVALSCLRDIPQIVRFYEVRYASGSYVLIMEFVEGSILRDVLRGLGAAGRLSVELALR